MKVGETYIETLTTKKIKKLSYIQLEYAITWREIDTQKTQVMRVAMLVFLANTNSGMLNTQRIILDKICGWFSILTERSCSEDTIPKVSKTGLVQRSEGNKKAFFVEWILRGKWIKGETDKKIPTDLRVCE